MTHWAFFIFIIAVIAGILFPRPPIPLNSGMERAIEVCAFELAADDVSVERLYDENKLLLSNSMSVIYKNCQNISLDDENIRKYIDKAAEIIVLNLDSINELPELLQITIYEGFDYEIISKKYTISKRYDIEYLSNLYYTFNSNHYRFGNAVEEFVNSKRYGAALDLCDSFIVQDSLIELAYQYKAMVHYNMGDTIPAIKSFISARSVNPSNDENYLNISILYKEFEMYSQAKLYVDTALNLNDQSAKATYIRGWLKLADGDTIGGCSDLKTAANWGYEIPGPALLFGCEEL